MEDNVSENIFIESPICVIVGNKGSGKTLYLTSVAIDSIAMKKTVYANYHLKGIPYIHFTEDMLKDISQLKSNSVILIDEGQMLADSYNFLTMSARQVTLLATQLRKRGLDLYITTQRFKFITARLRELTDYIIACQNVKNKKGNIVKGFVYLEVYDRNDPLYFNTPKSKAVLDLTAYFPYYNTREIIM